MDEQGLVAIEARVRELDEATAAWLAVMWDSGRHAGPPGDVERRYDQARAAIRAHGERDVPALVAEVRRLRGVMREVYDAGTSQPGNRTAATVEPLWRALQQTVGPGVGGMR